MGQGNVSYIIFSPLKVPAAGSVGSAGIRCSSSTSPGAPFLLFPEKDIVFLCMLLRTMELSPIERWCRWRNGAILNLGANVRPYQSMYARRGDLFCCCKEGLYNDYFPSHNEVVQKSLTVAAWSSMSAAIMAQA